MSESTPNDRLTEFEDEVAGLRIQGGSSNSDKRGMYAGVVLFLAGAVCALVAFFQSSAANDARDQRDLIILALLGLVLAIGGAALFVVNALTRWFRYWLIRLIFEHRSQVDRLAADEP